MSDNRRRTIRSWLESATSSRPGTLDFASMQFPEEVEPIARRWASAVQKRARPEAGVLEGQEARAVADEAADSIVALLPADWRPAPEDPIRLAEEASWQ